MEENKKSPECELEALKKLKKTLFLDFWAYDCSEKKQEKFLQMIKYLDYAGYSDEVQHFCELCDACSDVDEMEQFCKDYFGV